MLEELLRGYEKNFWFKTVLPLKLNASGVMPIIFAQAIMFVPSVGGIFLKDTPGQFANFADILVLVQYCICIINYRIYILLTAITVPTIKWQMT